ncbi:hypothetical protein HDV64DRAFT_254294 [Trichoderma sp. TUCIM 5745]
MIFLQCACILFVFFSYVKLFSASVNLLAHYKGKTGWTGMDVTGLPSKFPQQSNRYCVFNARSIYVCASPSWLNHGLGVPITCVLYTYLYVVFRIRC